MSRIKIQDLPQDLKISKEELKKFFGGAVMRIDASLFSMGIDEVNSEDYQAMLDYYASKERNKLEEQHKYFGLPTKGTS